MKILVIANDMKNGGVERVLSVLSNYFSDRGNTVRILAIRTNNVSYPVKEGVEFDFMPLRPEMGDETIRQEFNIMKELFKYMRKFRPDVLLGFDDSIIVRSVPLAWLLRKRIIVSERIDPSIYGRFMRFVRQIAYDMADAVVFQTADARDFFPKRTRKKSVIIPNPISDNLPKRSETTNKDILMACRLHPQKNVHLAIQAFAKFFPTHPDYRLVVYGEGELLDDLKKLANELGVGDNVVFPGHVDDVHKRMAECAMYLSSSDYEGISNSMLEAMAIGVPSICTDCPVGGAKMFIDDEINGLLVPVGNADAMAEALSKVADNKELSESISKESVKIRNILSIDVICPQWEKLL